MYTFYDYIHNGIVFANNILRKRHKKLTSLMIYATTSCQSRCKHCSIWKKPTEHLRLKDIIAIMNSKCITKHTVVGLEGGEFILHPEADEILSWFDVHHPEYTLLSNGLAAEKVISAVRNHRPKHLYLSLDGNRNTYQNMRGCDGYDKVIKVLKACKDSVPVSLMFCLSPWNTFEDMAYVIDIAKKQGVDVRIGIYSTMSFFDTTKGLLEANNTDFIRQIPPSIHQTNENFDFVALYDEWKNGRLKLRCHSIFNELVIHSNGDVPLCQNLNVALGNIHKQSLDEIFNARTSCNIQCRHSKECNRCWINYHRKFDIILLRNLESVLPKRMIAWFYGPYQWTTDDKTTYKKHFKHLTT
ncbi:radical SAM protein [Segatella maculosa]|uniref:Radical SAM additional 4Fe4S-binding domain-containing protein n=1 Tax=Segatella maculosa OT 289 TaxID=999422 RepID=H1HKF3_9BACT|nr:radical SAM protein [Segatella maculosa]EHO73054.1 hypothetical protein HMPREF9944_00647 [Segatella maculosa OT 289]